MNRRRFIGTFSAAATAVWGGRSLGLANEVDAPDLRLIYFTDVHAMLEREAPMRLQESARRIGDWEADAIIGGGDFVHGGFDSTPSQMAPRFELCHRFLESLGRPIEAVPGNHDMVGVRGEAPQPDPYRLFREWFGVPTLTRRFDVRGYRFFVLKSVRPVEGDLRYHGEIGEEQRAWLARELAATPHDQPLVLCSHIPLRTTFKQVQENPGAPLPPNLVVQDANETLALFAAHRLVLVLSGHLHVNEWIRWNDQHFLMGGALCGKWWRGDNLGTAPGFGLIEIQDGRLDWRYQST